jgi:hypothetical protein
MPMMNVATVRELAAQLRAALVEIDAGRVEASDVQRAYLVGSVDTLDSIVASPA